MNHKNMQRVATTLPILHIVFLDYVIALYLTPNIII